MASIKTIILFLFTVLSPSAIILAQDSPGETPIVPVETTEALSGDPKPPSGFHWPSWFSGISSGDGGSGPEFPESDVAAPETDFTGVPPLSRQKRRVIRCNFASQGSLSCHSCHEVHRCYPLNYGTITTCSSALRYCYRGRCSSTQGALCKATTSSSSSSSTTESTSTSTSDSTSTSTRTSSLSTSPLTSSSSSTSPTTSASSSTSPTTSASSSTTPPTSSSTSTPTSTSSSTASSGSR